MLKRDGGEDESSESASVVLEERVKLKVSIRRAEETEAQSPECFGAGFRA